MNTLEIAYAEENNPIGYYGYGWAFYKSNGTAFKDNLYTANDDDIKTWCLGFLGAMAEDYPVPDSMKDALLFCNVDCRIIAKLLKLTDDAIAESDNFIRLPPII